MSVTLATEKQAEAIRQRMSEIRTSLPYDVDDAREHVRRWGDWRYHMSRHPLPILAATVVVGYSMVPAKRTSAPIIVTHRAANDPHRVHQTGIPAKRGMLSRMVGAVGTLVVRQMTVIAAQHISNALPKRGPS